MGSKRRGGEGKRMRPGNEVQSKWLNPGIAISLGFSFYFILTSCFFSDSSASLVEILELFLQQQNLIPVMAFSSLCGVYEISRASKS